MRLPQCQIVCGFLSLMVFAAHSAEVRSQEKAATIPPIKRVLPPEGIAIPADVEKRLREELAAASKKFEPLKEHPHAADIEVFLKAVRYALDLREFYTEKDFAKADALLKEANERITQLAAKKHPWTTATGTVVRGYRSQIDKSAQPYGVVLPQNFDFNKPAPLYIWLHGRGDKQTDLHFLYERMSKPGQITPPGAVVVHAFGRQCVGYKHVGEVDVLEVRGHAQIQYRTDRNKTVLIGFSMGGAGAWHVGAHYASNFQVIAPGAGFAETANYQKLKPEDYPPWYEQKLWGQNDTPAYVRNLFNTQVIAYSGELDRQIQAARVMEEAYQAEGRKLEHLIGPKTEHKYEPKTLATLLSKIDAALQASTGELPKKVSLQTRTLRYPMQYWVAIHGLEEHWLDSRVDAEAIDNRFVVSTKNVTSLTLANRVLRDPHAKIEITIDGQKLQEHIADPNHPQICYLIKQEGKWQTQSWTTALRGELRKAAGAQGPIDEAFTRPFLVVTPSGQSKNPRFQAWMEFELAHFRDRWRALMRGDLREMQDTDVTPIDLMGHNLILWGDADSNSLIKDVLPTLPIQQRGDAWEVLGEKYDVATHVPVMIYPYRGSQNQCVVLNSGLTFREAHDRTNSLQNPKLPDWAMIDITQPPDASAPGKVVNAGFFDEEWKLKPSLK